MTRPAACGTYGGYQRHRRRKEEACDACKKAMADYQFAYRRDNPAAAKWNGARVNARQRAAFRVAQEHPETFARYVEEEWAKR